MGQRKQRRDRATIAVKREQHQRYRDLLNKTGLHPTVFMDRLLQLADRNVNELVSTGIRAVG